MKKEKEGINYKSGLWDEPMSAEGAGWCYSGKVPVDWKKVNIKPVFRMGEKKSVGNYRQASVTSVPRENDGATNNGNPFQTHFQPQLFCDF